MRITEITKQALTLEQMVGMIERDCKPFLSAVQNLPNSYRLYRGVVGKALPFSKQKVRTDRRPRDTSESVHAVADAWFQEKTGIPFRSSSVFASGDYRIASEYGSEFIIFPIGNFKFCWSPNVSDMTYDLLGNLSDEDDADEEIIDLLAGANYQTNNLMAAIDSGNEIMIRCQEYYLVTASNGENPLAKSIIRNLCKGST